MVKTRKINAKSIETEEKTMTMTMAKTIIRKIIAKDKIDKSAGIPSYQVGWIDYTLQNNLGQKFWQHKIQNARTLQWKSKWKSDS